MAQLSYFECALLAFAAAGIGFSKSGFAGVSMLHVIIFAFVFGAKASTGVLLPMLVIGDVCAICFFGKKVQWRTMCGAIAPHLGRCFDRNAVMDKLDEAAFKPLVGTIILTLTAIQLWRTWKPTVFEKLPHSRWFAWTLGLLAGVTTMLANAAGPVVALYLLAVALPKLELVGTGAWLFLVVNVFKLPFSYSLGLIELQTLVVDIVFSPAIILGMLAGSWAVKRIPQRLFNSCLLAFTALAALRLIGVV